VGLAADNVYDTLLSELLSGMYPAGFRIREEDVAARIGTSRTPVREALRRLHAEGLIDLPANRGAIVADSAIHKLDDLFEVRALLEGYGAERAATRRSDADLAGMRALCDQMEELAAKEAFGELTTVNVTFHRSIQAAAGIEALIGMLPGLMVTPLVRETFRHYRHEELARSMSQHRELVSALERGDGAWAKAVMCAHLYAAKASLRDQITQPPGQ
jgi:DNA-binding GntR family transcriptional regulator